MDGRGGTLHPAILPAQPQAQRMPASDIVIKGAREHNLQDVNLVLPRNQLICLTGVSGSGKSSLAFDTLFAEGQRRYVESLSSFARQFLGQMPKPDVDLIDGLSPSISISQKTSGQNPRSTVGTITEIYDFLRVLYARVGQGHCPSCHRPITAQTQEQIIGHVMQLPAGSAVSILAPLIRGQKGEHRDLFDSLLKQGFARARVDGQTVSLSDRLDLDRQMRHNIEVVIDRLKIGPNIRSRLAEAVEVALKLGDGNLIAAVQSETSKSPLPADLPPEAAQVLPTAGGGAGSVDMQLSAHYACTHCHRSFEPPSPQLFSFNSPQGMCPNCDGLGEVFTFDPALLVTHPELSFQQGCFELIGKWREMGRWRRHMFKGLADTIERLDELEEGHLLETAWNDLEPKYQQMLLYGAGDTHITYTWTSGGSVHKYGGHWEGIIPELRNKHKNANGKMQRRGLEKYMTVVHCEACHGTRLNSQATAVTLTTTHPRFADKASRTLPEVCNLAVLEASDFFSELELNTTGKAIAAEALKEICGRLGFLINVGLEYLSLDRTAPSLSGGESQRIRLAGQIGCGLVGVLYILDEPSIGLHPRDNTRLIDTLTQLRDLGNTVVVVEHDEETMRASDHLIDFGPGPGVRGGEVVAEGSLAELVTARRSITGKYLSGEEAIAVPEVRRATGENWLRVVEAKQNNLKNVTAEFPLGTFICVTGVSGSGKSSLVNDVLSEALWRDLNGGDGNPGLHARIEGMDHLDKLIAIDQSPIGRTPRSNPATYIKVFDEIRKLYMQLPDSKARGYREGRFSFNVKGGRCEACEGNGSNKLEMDFLADVWVTCPVCDGHRFNRETLQIRFKGKSIAEVLEMDVQQALEHFENIPKVRDKLQTLHDVGLDYIKLGQASPTLSGGEAQRVKLARELTKRSTGQTLYLLDEPTTGLHFADVKLLLKVLHNFVSAGNTVLVVEHNLDVIKTADWIIDMGPEGGGAGGEILVTGTPEEVAACPRSHTGRALAELLEREAAVRTARANGTNIAANGQPGKRAPRVIDRITAIKVRGARQHNLKDIDVEIPRDKMTVLCGPSGSGKTSLAMDTIYAEGQRRYVESLSSYARQFVSQVTKPQLEHIEGLSPAIAIEQKNLGSTPRSTVGTVTEIYDYLRILFARLGTPYCPDCDLPIGTQTVDEVVDKLMALPEGTRLYLMAPLEVHVGETYETHWTDLQSRGYQRIRVNGKTYSLDEPPKIDRRRKHDVDVVVDRIVIRPDSRGRIADSVEGTLSLGQGVLRVAFANDDVAEAKWPVQTHSQHLACDSCGRSFEPLTPHHFSFNSPLGWCPACEGLGVQTGANPAALILDPRLTLAEGAIAVWPSMSEPIFKLMLEAFSAATGIPSDKSYGSLSAKERRLIMHGTGDEWFDVWPDGKAAKKGSPLFRFQYKGLYPALEEASKLSPRLRTRLEHLVDEVECATCGGSRLRDDASAYRVREKTIDDLCRTALGELHQEFAAWKPNVRERKIAGELVREVQNRLQFLTDVGLEYLTLGRPGPTLSGGEAQRIRLASQVGSGLTGVLYVLDEPTIGLHPRDNRRLIRALERLRDLGNTLLIVEHDKEVIAGADQLLDFGPGAGRHGGNVVAQGTPIEVGKTKTSVTGPYLSGAKNIAVPTNRRMPAQLEVEAPPIEEAKPKRGKKKATKKAAAKGRKAAAADANGQDANGQDAKLAAANGQPPRVREARQVRPLDTLEIVGARQHNLRGINVEIPLGAFIAVTGVSGSGKSSLIDDILYRALSKRLHRASTFPGAHDALKGVAKINKVIRVDQQPLGNTPTSNPATYTGVFELIRELFSQLPDARVRGYTARRFSFNVPGGRCDKCEGAGQLRIEMHFLPDVWVTCDVCDGKRYNAETLAVRYQGRSIADVLEMPIGEAVRLFKNIPKIRRTLQVLCDVGLDYLTLGQSAPTLSGGEAQRVKLAAELARPDTGRTIYLLDEPTTGLHFDDLAKLLDVLNRLVDLGNTVVVIEHNLDVIKTADWLIDMGPEAGEGGGQLVVAGTPEDVAEHARRQASGKYPDLLRSYTGEALAPVLAAGPHAERAFYDPLAAEQKQQEDLEITEVGRDVPMPWQEDGRRWHTIDRVARRGEPCRWDGKILAMVVDRIQDQGEFNETNWNDRSVVEITGTRKSDGWFFHAITGEPWLLKMKFRVARRTFKREDLTSRLNLPPLDEMHDLPVYGSEPRVKCKNLAGPWQEIELRVHSLDEIDRPEFWAFLDEAIAGFGKHQQRVQQNPDDVMPWKVLGRKWHLSRRGFPLGKSAQWPTELLEELCERISEVAPEGEFLWNNQTVVHFLLPGRSQPWVSLHTKKPHALEVALHGPKDSFAYGELLQLGADRELLTEGTFDVIRIQLRSPDDLHQGGLVEFLGRHHEAVSVATKSS